MEPPQGGRKISSFRVTKRSTKRCRLSKTTRSRVHVQTVGLNAETKKCRHRADGEECLLTFPFIGLFRMRACHSSGYRSSRSRRVPGPNNSEPRQNLDPLRVDTSISPHPLASVRYRRGTPSIPCRRVCPLP